MIQKVARAVILGLCDHKGIRQALDDIDEETMLGIELEIARAAIAAMREPSEVMLKAGSAEALSYNNVDLAFHWRHMIDAALAKGDAQ